MLNLKVAEVMTLNGKGESVLVSVAKSLGMTEAQLTSGLTKMNVYRAVPVVPAVLAIMANGGQKCHELFGFAPTEAQKAAAGLIVETRIRIPGRRVGA